MIEHVSFITNPELPGIQVFAISSKLVKGEDQEVLVVCAPNTEIPLHHHESAAAMFVVSGEATVLADNKELDGVTVKVGSHVYFEPRSNHGFKAGPSGMNFISHNGGIVNTIGTWDMVLA